MRIVHFSDWHWSFSPVPLPEADLYVCTGDMYPNGPMFADDGHWGSFDYKLAERRFQIASANKLTRSPKGGTFRRFLSSPSAPIVCVRGNHDFAPLSHLFEGTNFVHEFVDNEVISVWGLRITGHRGIPWINGAWSDEESRSDLVDRVRRMPEADLYLTHYPPSGIDLDSVTASHHYGLDEMLNFLAYRQEKPGLHCFGHIHERGGETRQIPRMLFSNAATTFNVLEGNQDDGWRDVSPL